MSRRGDRPDRTARIDFTPPYVIIEGPEAISLFLRDEVEVAAGVKAPLQRFAKGRDDARVLDNKTPGSRRRFGFSAISGE